MSLIRPIPFSSFKKSNTKHTILLLGLIFFLTLQGFGQALTITSPTSETIWSGGTTHEITWSGGASENVKIKLWWGDLMDATIVESTPNDGSYTWTVLDGYTEKVVLFIYGDNENAYTTFTRENSAGGIYINSPTTGVTWQPGSTHNITWIDNIGENVKIDLYYASDGPIQPSYASTITSSTPSDGYYSWTIPIGTSQEKYQIKIESVSASSTRVYSRHFDIGEETSSCIDSYEPNDAIDNPSKFAFSSDIGGIYYKSESIAGTIHESGDWDHYRVNVEVPGNLDITLTNVPNAFDLQLYANPPEGYVAGSFTTGNEYIDVDISTPGFYYIIVGSLDGAYDCSPYTLAVDWTADLFLDVTPTSRSVGSASGTTTFDISSNANWSVSEDASWLSIEKTNSELLTAIFDENSEFVNRSTSITVSADGVSSKIVTVTQEGSACNLVVTPDNQSVGPDAGTTNFNVTSNVSWSVNKTSDWLSTSVDGSTITINYEANESTYSRVATVSVAGGECSEMVTVTQEGVACSLAVTPENQNVGSASGIASFTVTSNVSWSVNETADWLSTSVDGNIISVSFDTNGTSSSRSASITITAGECSKVVTLVQEEGEQPQFLIGSSAISLGATAGTAASFSITSNVDWSIEKNALWLDVNPMTGTGSYQVQVKANESNNTGETRSDTLQASGNGITYLIVVTQDFVTGVIDLLESGINLYPNPSGSELYVKLGTQLSDFTVRIFDSRGSFLFINSYKSATEFTIDLGKFKSGIYQIKIMHKDGSIVRTFIKR